MPRAKKKTTTRRLPQKAPERHTKGRRMEDRVKFLVGILSIAAALFTVAAVIFAFVLDIRMMADTLGDLGVEVAKLAVAHAEDKGTLEHDHEKELDELEGKVVQGFTVVREDIELNHQEALTIFEQGRKELVRRLDTLEDDVTAGTVERAILKEKVR